MFIINLIPLHVFVLLLMQRFSTRVYVGKYVLIKILRYLKVMKFSCSLHNIFYNGCFAFHANSFCWFSTNQNQ